MMRKLIAVSVVLVGVLLASGKAEAAGCSISATPVAFGTYDVFVTMPLDSVGGVTYNCNGGAKSIAITISQGGAGTFARKLFQTTEWLGYNLYRDPSRAVVWGNGTSGTAFYFTTSVPNNTDVSVPVYGRVDPGQDVRAGSYGDHVSVTINF
jgi:spore coat protein U-like protein